VRGRQRSRRAEITAPGAGICDRVPMTSPVPRARMHRPASGGRVFRGVLDARPYPVPPLTSREWAQIPPRVVLLADLITVKAELRLDVLLAEDSTFYGDLFGHVVAFEGELYLDDGLHRAVQAALHQRSSMHVRIAKLEADGSWGSSTD
jgi:Arc/MetJ family transcription regulator